MNVKMLVCWFLGFVVLASIEGSAAECQNISLYQYEWGYHDYYQSRACNDTLHYFYAAQQCLRDFTYAVSGFISGSYDAMIFTQLCTDGADCFKECMLDQFSLCDADFKMEIENTYIPDYVKNFCSGDSVASHLTPYEGSYNEESWLNLYTGIGSCNYEEVYGIFFGGGNCYYDLIYVWYDFSYHNDSMDGNSTGSVQSKPFKDVRERLSRRIQSLAACVVNNITLNLKKANCESSDHTVFGAMAIYTYIYYVAPGIDYPLADLLELFTVKENPGERERYTVAVFGDPHMYIYNPNGVKGKYITCAAPGNQEFLSNSYVSIYGVNTAPSPSWEATYMTQVTITFYDANTGGMLGSYEAEDTRDYSYQLPIKFTDGEVSLYYADSTLAVSLTKKDSFMVMEYKDAGVIISLARFSYTYMLAARQSKSVFLRSSGLLKEGCDEIDRNEIARRRKRSADACANVTEEYKEACTFDYAVTGDAGLAAGTGNVMTSIIEETESRDANVITDTDTTTASTGYTLHYSLLIHLIVAAAAVAALYI